MGRWWVVKRPVESELIMTVRAELTVKGVVR